MIGFITQAILDRELTRLSLQRQFPENPEAVIVLSDTLRALAKDAFELHDLVSAWLEQSEYSPTEAGLRAALAAIRETYPTKDPKKPEKCALCGDTGYSQVWWLQSIRRLADDTLIHDKQWLTKEQYQALRKKLSPDNWDQRVYDGVTHCKCPKGRNIVGAIAAKEADRHKGSVRA